MIIRALVTMAAAAALLAGPAGHSQNQGRPLFNGKDLTGWEGDRKFWSVKDGAITGQTTPQNPTMGNTFLLWKDGTLKDFELRVKFKIVGGNSGIQYRSKHLGNYVVGGYQADFEDGDRYNGIIYEERGRGILAEPGLNVVRDSSGVSQVVGTVNEPDRVRAAVKRGEWNEYLITAKGPRMTHTINGVQTIEFTDLETEKRAMEGILALQLHAGPPMTVQFKDILLKQ